MPYAESTGSAGAVLGRMRILHVIPSFAPRYGGPIVAAVGLTRELARRGHDVTVATTNVDGPGELDVPLSRPVPMDGVDVWYFPIQRPRWYHFSAPMGRALRELVRRSDVVHIHSVFLWPTTVAAFWCRRLGVPIRGTTGSLDPVRSPSDTRVCARRPPAGPRSGSISGRLADVTWAARQLSTSPPRPSWSQHAAFASHRRPRHSAGRRRTAASRGRRPGLGAAAIPEPPRSEDRPVSIEARPQKGPRRACGGRRNRWPRAGTTSRGRRGQWRARV